jgi:8-oxo-dGTP pyrophosphatase MutT (NUDIX family)
MWSVNGPRAGALRLHDEIRSLVADVVPEDAVEEEYRRQALAWLDSTGDIFRRIKPRTPDPHLVSYFLLIDHHQDAVLLCDHRKAGLWLPTGGHVEVGEHPAATVRREAREELGVEARFSTVTREMPLFVTVTETVPSAGRHTDVSLWYVLSQSMSRPLTPDTGEFRSVRWWTRKQIALANPAVFDPHMSRMLRKLDHAIDAATPPPSPNGTAGHRRT